jgi:hypothetical protein
MDNKPDFNVDIIEPDWFPEPPETTKVNESITKKDILMFIICFFFGMTISMILDIVKLL